MSRQVAFMEEVKGWVYEAGDFVKEELRHVITVEEKSNRHDLVTNVDKATEQFLVNKIKKHYPNDTIIGEEGTGKSVTSKDGRLWIIDPIDGTLNFVKQQENFCIMIGIFEGGKASYGFIYNVMKDEFAYGGRHTGIFINEKEIKNIDNIGIRDGLIGCNAQMYTENLYHATDICKQAVGVRMLGCAGIDFLNVITGRQNGYLSKLAPWDFAAGIALAEPLGLICKQIPDLDYDILGDRQFFVVATEKTYHEIVSDFK